MCGQRYIPSTKSAGCTWMCVSNFGISHGRTPKDGVGDLPTVLPSQRTVPRMLPVDILETLLDTEHRAAADQKRLFCGRSRRLEIYDEKACQQEKETG